MKFGKRFPGKTPPLKYHSLDALLQFRRWFQTCVLILLESVQSCSSNQKWNHLFATQKSALNERLCVMPTNQKINYIEIVVVLTDWKGLKNSTDNFIYTKIKFIHTSIDSFGSTIICYNLQCTFKIKMRYLQSLYLVYFSLLRCNEKRVLFYLF